MSTTDKHVTHTLKVTSGPSTDRLMDAFKYAFSQTPIPIAFAGNLNGDIIGNENGEYEVTVLSIEHEDSSGHSFNVTGTTSGNLSVYGYYNARTRTGSLTFTSPYRMGH